MLFDTHAHLDDARFDSDRDEVIKNLIREGVSYVVNIGADIQSSRNSVELARKYDFIYAAVGVHPHEADSMTDCDLAELEELSKYEKVVAIGEIGLDYHYDNSDRTAQKYWFEKQLLLAKKLNMPYIIHDREAHGDTLDIIRKVGYTNGVMHCFSGSSEMAKQIVKMGMYVSIAGPVTFKNAGKLIDVAQVVPDERLLIETDCPYLTPEPFRSKRNNPAYVKYTAEKIAQLRGMEFSQLAKMTLENAKRFYNI